MFPSVENRPAIYQRNVVCAQDVFQRRLRKVEVELAQAQQDLHALHLQDHALAVDRSMAVAMAGNDRLGSRSPLFTLPDELLHAIIEQAIWI
jgi:hypothetical protein